MTYSGGTGVALPANLPSTAEGDWQMSGGAGLAGDNPSGAPELRTGGPGESSLLVNRHPLSGGSQRLTSVSFTFQYIIGYGGPASTAQAPDLSLVVLNADDKSVVAEVAYETPLDKQYTFDSFTSFSPPIIAIVSVDVPNTGDLLLAVRVNNNARNLQLLLSSLSLSATTVGLLNTAL